jgi:hypothetical protein
VEERLTLTSCIERIARGERPHASQELGKSTVEECHTHNGIWNGNVAHMHVVKREDKRRRPKSEQASTVIQGG